MQLSRTISDPCIGYAQILLIFCILYNLCQLINLILVQNTSVSEGLCAHNNIKRGGVYIHGPLTVLFNFMIIIYIIKDYNKVVQPRHVVNRLLCLLNLNRSPWLSTNIIAKLLYKNHNNIIDNQRILRQY